MRTSTDFFDDDKCNATGNVYLELRIVELIKLLFPRRDSQERIRTNPTQSSRFHTV